MISLNDTGDEGVANPKGSCCKGVGNPGVDVIPVDVAVACDKGHKVEVPDIVGAQQDGKKFVEDDVLPLGIQDTAGFLELKNKGIVRPIHFSLDFRLNQILYILQNGVKNLCLLLKLI